MAGAEALPGDEEFVELLSFLTDPKLEVQKAAAEAVLSQTTDHDFMDFCRRCPRKVAKPLLRLSEKAESEAATSGTAAKIAAAAGGGAVGQKAARAAAVEAAQALQTGSAALKALVNVSSIPTVRDELVELGAPRRVSETMRGGWLEGRSGLAHWYSMLLANITTGTEGQEAVCSDETTLRFLLAAFVSKPRPPPREGADDPLQSLGKLMGNCCALETGRKILAGGEQGPATVTTLIGELGDRGRRADVIAALRNLCLDKDCHPALVASNLAVKMASFLYPWSKATAEQKAALPEELLTILSEEGAALTTDSTVRYAGAICVLGLCRSDNGRAYLRGSGFLQILEAWKLEESDVETLGALDAAIPSLAGEEIALDGAEASSANVEEVADEEPATDLFTAPTVAPGPLPPKDEQATADAAEGDMVELFAGIED